MYNSVVCSTFNVKCSWDGLLEGRNCSCVWLFWCSELCKVDQTVTVQRGSVLDVRGPEWFCHPFCSLWISTVPGEWGGLCSWAEPDSYWRAEDWFSDGRVELFQQLLWQLELPQLAKEVQLLLGLFHNGLNVIVPLQFLRNCGAQPGIWMTPLQSQCCSWWWVIKSSNFGFLWDGDDGGAFETWGDFTQLQWSVEDLCEDGGQLVSTGFQTDWCHRLGLVPSLSCSFWRPGARRLLLSAVHVWGRWGLQKVWMVVFQTCNRTHSCQLLILHSA